MELVNNLRILSDRIVQQGKFLKTEEATKTAFILPFIQNVLGYDIFNPAEVVPEFVADVGTKKGEKVDYAIIKDGIVQMLIECKKYGDPLNPNCANQLYRYFSVTSARIAILTDGAFYQFYTDLDAPNKMDSKPFLELFIGDVDEHVIPELSRLTKNAFDIDAVINSAGELKYIGLIKKIIATQLASPDDDFIKIFASRIHEGTITKGIKEQFATLTKKAFSQFISDNVNDRLKSALKGEPLENDARNQNELAPTDVDAEKIATTVEEWEGFHIIKAIGREAVEVDRIAFRDTQSYFGVLLDDNNRKPICRLHFNRSQKYLGLFDEGKKETRHPINKIDDIYNFASDIKKSIIAYASMADVSSQSPSV